jgi:trehalose 6-phosphate phosphatase
MGVDAETVLRELRSDPARTALLFDFDGTLSPIVDDPAAAVPLPEVPGLLRELAGRYGTVAVVSGRPVRYLQGHLPAGPTLIGLYGLERADGDDIAVHPDAAPWRAVVDDTAAAASSELPAEVVVEHKGLSLTLHVRQHPALSGVVEAWATDVGNATGLLLRRARRSIELHPPVAADKGTAVTELLGRDRSTACFIGDDVGDLPAFDALDRFCEAGGQAFRMVVSSTETDPVLARRADFLLDGPEAVSRLLQDLLAP